MTTPMKYAVLARTAQLQSVPLAQTADLENTSIELKNFTVAAGTLVKVLPETVITAQEPTVASNVQVYVYDTVLREPVTTRIYQCASNSLLPVSDDLWPFIISIPEPQRRLHLLLDQNRCEWLNKAKPGDLVFVPGRCLEQEGNVRYDCVVCYIGPVPEIHSVGFFFGLELLDDTPSPQTAGIPFTRKYFECDAENSIFVTADRLLPKQPKQGETPVAPESANTALVNDTSIITSFINFMSGIRASMPF